MVTNEVPSGVAFRPKKNTGRRLIFPLAIGLFSSFSLRAQTCSDHFLGTKTLYRAPAAFVVKAPAGYRPVFINYVGRHGARHLTKPPESELIYALLLEADSTGALSPAGRHLKNMIGLLATIESGGVKSISEEGKEELQGIARRMVSTNPAVFSGKPRISVTVTKEVRTGQSALAFLQGLHPLLKDEEIRKLGINDTILRFYDGSPAYTSFLETGSWLKPFTALRHSLKLREISDAITSRFFKPAFYKTIPAVSRLTFASDLFGFAAIVYSLKPEITAAGHVFPDLDFRSLLSCKEISALSAADVAEDYYKKGPGIDPGGIQVKIAVPLLADFLYTTDEYIRNQPLAARLRFAHAETISPFATLLGLAPASKQAVSANAIGKAWNASAIIPLSANIQWVLYKNAAGNYLVKFLLNEQPVLIRGLNTSRRYFYPWQEVRRFYQAKLHKAGVYPGEKMSAFLETVN